jgi:hypothetical protein
MPRNVEWRLVVDESGAIKKMEMVGKEAEKTDKTFQKTKKSTKDFEGGIRSLGSAFGGLKGMVGMGLGALGAGGLAFGLKDIIGKTNEIATETEKFHSISGMGANTSLHYVAALKARGISAEAGGKAFGFLAKNLETAERQQYTFAVAQDKAAAKGKQTTSLLGVQATAFQKLGINLGSFNRLSEEAKFDLITKKFEAMAPGAKKTDLALRLFGRGGKDLLPVLENNNLALTKQMTLAERFFPTLKGGSKTLDELREKQAESKMAWEGLEFTLGTTLAPVLSQVMGDFSSLIAEVEKGQGAWGTAGKLIGGVAHDLEGVVRWGKEAEKFLGIGGGSKSLSTHGKPAPGVPAPHHGPTGLEVGLGLAGGFAALRGLTHPFKSLKALTGLTSGFGRLIGFGAGDSALSGAAAFGGGLTGFAALAAGGAIPFASAKGFKAGVEAIHPGMLKLHSPTEQMEQALFGHIGTKRMAYGQTQARSVVTTPHPSAVLLSKLLEHPNLITTKSASGLTRADLEYLAAQFHKAHEHEPRVIQLMLPNGRVLLEENEREALKRAARR